MDSIKQLLPTSVAAKAPLAARTSQKKRPLTPKWVDTMQRVMFRDTVFKHRELKSYLLAALRPCPLPDVCVAILCEHAMQRPELFGLFVDRLSDDGQRFLHRYFMKKTGLSYVGLQQALEPPWWHSLCPGVKTTEEHILLQVLHQEFPVDFALYLFPEWACLSRIVSTTLINRPASYNLFHTLLNMYFRHQRYDLVNFALLPKINQLVLMPVGSRSKRLLLFQYPRAQHETLDAHIAGLMVLQKVALRRLHKVDNDFGFLLNMSKTSSFSRADVTQRHMQAFAREQK